MAIASGLVFSPSRRRPGLADHGWSTFPYFLKEASGSALGRIIGYQHLAVHADLG